MGTTCICLKDWPGPKYFAQKQYYFVNGLGLGLTFSPVGWMPRLDVGPDNNPAHEHPYIMDRQYAMDKLVWKMLSIQH